ncbi:hypothetical protein FAZ15_22205 [Sphingobacterium olei]|uniref:Uncharacterized protein n=1 Tax=Sphingobacterium olei TaxID=2571155 RepID=A0A4U0N8G0_9SPHI|nr:hypothetical protein [Sphingobacterium olei]TJZ49873.1 hypothetical protein FAZ15_22205 [Sphingobacterium olei]
MQLSASAHNPTAFIFLLPLCDLSNINHHVQSAATTKFKYPVVFWTPDKDIEKLVAIDKNLLYEKVYDKALGSLSINETNEIARIKAIICLLIQKKDALQYADLIRILRWRRNVSGASHRVIKAYS